jgi:hypothetical protein
MEITVTAWGPSREAAIQFLADIKVAGTDEHGNLIPVADVQITPHQPGDEITVWETKPEYDADGKVNTEGIKAPGFFFNMRFYGKSAATLTHGLPQTDDKGQQLSLFERTHILDLVSMRTKRSPEWKATEAPVKPGYEDPATGCRCFDPATIKTPVRVFA